MNNNYVLWVEDQPQNLIDFKNDIEEDGSIKLVIVKDARSAIDYLDQNIEKLSAAVLDIESFINPESDEETKTSFCRVRDHINKLEHRNKIEYFAFTGKAKYLKEKEGFSEEYRCKIFDKNYEGLEAEEYLRKIVNTHIIAQIVNKYGKAFELCQDIRPDLLSILMVIENHDYRNADVFNRIRKVLEWIAEYCYEIGLSQIVFNGTNLNEWSAFSGEYKMNSLIPSYIQRSIHSAVVVTNTGSHRTTIDQDTKEGKAPYLVQSTVYELLNIILWLNVVPTDKNSISERKEKTRTIYEEFEKKQKKRKENY